MKKINLSKLFKKKSHPHARAPLSILDRPASLWHLMLGIFFACTLAVLLYGISMCYRISHDDFSGTSDMKSTLPPLIDRSKLDGVLTLFSDRADILQEVTNVKPQIADPSL